MKMMDRVCLSENPMTGNSAGNLYIWLRIRYNCRKTAAENNARWRLRIDLVVFPMKYAIYTLGCKVNQYETQAMEQILSGRGHEQGQFDQICDC